MRGGKAMGEEDGGEDGDEGERGKWHEQRRSQGFATGSRVIVRYVIVSHGDPSWRMVVTERDALRWSVVYTKRVLGTVLVGCLSGRKGWGVGRGCAAQTGSWRIFRQVHAEGLFYRHMAVSN